MIPKSRNGKGGGTVIFSDYVKSELLGLIPVLYLVGAALKKSKVPNRRIPLLLGLISVVLTALWVFSTTTVDNVGEAAEALFSVVTQGILTAGASVYANQLYRQSKKDK